jgi:hypothetical protein
MTTLVTSSSMLEAHSRVSVFRRLALSMFVIVAAVAAQLPSIAPAYATAGSHTITVVGSGGATENTGSPTWSITAGVITATGNVSINASDLESKLTSQNVTIDAATVVINHSIVSATSGRSLTLKATGNITVSTGVTIQTNNGNITLQSDSDASGSGAIMVGNRERNRTYLTSQGGNIVLSGGSNPSTGYAMAATGLTGTNASGGVPSPAAGLAIFESTFDAGGGNIVLRGKSALQTGSTRGVIIEAGNPSSRPTDTELVTTGSGAITVEGVGSDSNDAGIDNPWGVVFSGVQARTVSGAISITGASVESTASNEGKRGLSVGHSVFTSTSGDITLTDSSARFADYDGSYFNNVVSFSTAGDVVVRADEIDLEAANINLQFTTPKAVIRPNGGSNFTGALTLSGTFSAADAGELVIGLDGNTSAVTVATAITVGGPFTIYGSTIALNKAVTATASTLNLHASTAVTQSATAADKVTADKLALYGAGTFTLQNAANNVATLAGGSSGSPVGSVKYTDASGGLTIGTINPTGLYSSGDIEIATLSGDLLITQPVVSTKTSGDTVKLFAAKNETSGNAGDGDVKISGSGAVTVEAGARALIYSGTRSTSTGLVTLVGGNTNTRAPVVSGTVVSSLSPSVPATGKFAFFRVDDTFVEDNGGTGGGNAGGGSAGGGTTTTNNVTPAPTRSSAARIPGRAVLPPQEVAVEQTDVIENPVSTAPAPLPQTEEAEVALPEPENNGLAWAFYWVGALFLLVALALFFFLVRRSRRA